MYLVYTVVNSSSVWNFLSDCDVFNASRVLLVGQLIHRAVRSTNPTQVITLSTAFVSTLIKIVFINAVVVCRSFFD